MPKPWTEERILYLGFLIESGLNNVEIAKEFGKTRSTIQLAARRYFKGNPNYRIKITKHIHLRLPVFQYFLNHTWDETKNHFKLTDTELKSIFSAGYGTESLKALRKDKRCKRKWDAKDLVFMLQRVGLVRRETIGKKLGRGKDRVIKEKLQKLGVNSKTLQGMTLSTYRKNFGQEPSFLIETRAGPCGGFTGKFTLKGKFKIIPWVVLRDELKKGVIKTPELINTYIESMAMFQDWIFQGDVLNKMLKIVETNGKVSKQP